MSCSKNISNIDSLLYEFCILFLNKVKKCRDVDSIRNLKIRKILVTNSLKEFAIPILKHLKISDEFDEVYGADDFDDKKKFISSYLRKNKIKPGPRRLNVRFVRNPDILKALGKKKKKKVLVGFALEIKGHWGEGVFC